MQINKNHDAQYKELFSNPTLLAEFFHSFVDEKFVHELDFSTLKKLNTHFVTGKFRKREADIIFQIQFQKKPVYIYLLLEFQSTVDKFMALRILEYIAQFYRDLLKIEKPDQLPQVLPVVLYSGDRKWNAPTQFRDLLTPISIPNKYIPNFKYYKIAINEIPKSRLIEIKNAVAGIFYVEKSNPKELAQNIKVFVELIKAENLEVIQLVSDWLFMTQDYSQASKSISKIDELTEVTTMWATAVKEHDKNVALRAKQEILIDLLTEKFGKSVKARKKILTITDSAKIDKALKKFVTASTRDEVLDCLE
jgi:predicted transposase/invertase (TIGR01784 family)